MNNHKQGHRNTQHFRQTSRFRRFPVRKIPGPLSTRIKRPAHEVYSPPFSSEVNNEWSRASTPPVRHNGVEWSNCTLVLVCLITLSDRPMRRFYWHWIEDQPLSTVRPVYRDRRFATLQRTLFTYLINKYISLSDICLTVHHWYK